MTRMLLSTYSHRDKVTTVLCEGAGVDSCYSVVVAKYMLARTSVRPSISLAFTMPMSMPASRRERNTA
jgi:hypothetical protein